MTLKINVSINSGAALILFLGAFFLLLAGVAFFAPLEKNFVAAGALLVGAFGGYLKKRDANNAKALEAERLGLNCDPGKGAANG
jgi:hypothetical protein